MTNESLYNKTVDILVQAYFNDTLEHCNCYACAVGNIVAATNNISFINIVDTPTPEFGRTIYPGAGLLYWDKDNGFRDNLTACLPSEFPETKINEISGRHLKNTGYSLGQLRKIEIAFEGAPTGKCAEDYMFNGLMAVIEALDEIHENTDSDITKSSKGKFVKANI